MFIFRLKIKLAFSWTLKLWLQWWCARNFLVAVMLQWQGEDMLVQRRVMAMLLVGGTVKSAFLAAQVHKWQANLSIECLMITSLLVEEDTVKHVKCKEGAPVEGDHVGVCDEVSIWTGPTLVTSMKVYLTKFKPNMVVERWAMVFLKFGTRRFSCPSKLKKHVTVGVQLNLT
jgi:hypothetical protein